MIQQILHGASHSCLAVILFIGGKTLADVVPISDQTPVTIAVTVSLAGGAFFLGMRFGALLTKLKETNMRLDRMERKQDGDDADARKDREPDRH
jgi:hypothetical protein